MKGKSPAELSIELTESIQDGRRFSRSIKKITKNKTLLDKAVKLRERSSKRALRLGIIRPDEIMNAPVVPDKSEAERKLEFATGLKRTNFPNLSQEDIDFINGLPDDESRDVVIRELFSNKVLKEFNRYQVKKNNDVSGPRFCPSDRAKKFVYGYIEEYNKLLSGKPYRTLKEIAEDAGYSATLSIATIMAVPWTAMKIELYHQSIDKLADYHYRQIEDRKLRERVKVQDLKDMMIDNFIARPDKLLNAKVKDSAQMLKVLHEIQYGEEKSRSGPPVAIQINSDVANLAMSQNAEKSAHLKKSFNK